MAGPTGPFATALNYRRDSPCVASRVAVEANELVHLGAFPTHRMMVTAFMGWTETAYKRIVRVHILATVSSLFQK